MNDVRPYRSRWQPALLALLTGFALLAGAPAALATENLRKELTALSKQIKDLLDQEKQDAIAVGEFTGPAHLPGSGTLIKKTLIEELTKMKVSVKSDAKNFEVKGAYRDFLDKETDNGKGDKLLGLKITAQVYDANGDAIVKFPISARIVHGTLDLLLVEGPTVDLGAKGDDYTASKKLQETIYERDKNQPHIAGNRIAASDASPYSIEIRVKSGEKFVPRQPEIKNGLAFVSLQRDEKYVIALHNKSPHEASVRITIDGLNMFAFSEVKDAKTGQPLYSDLVCPKGSAVIKGWHVTNDKSDEFMITSYAKSAAAELQSKGEVGTIMVTFAAAWPKGQKPDDETGTRSSEIATGRGERVDMKYQLVEYESGVVRAAVSVRYTK